MRKINLIVIHCTATKEGRDHDVEEIRKWHIQQRGWSDIGYHYIIKLDGTVQDGRPLERPDAHARGHNKNSIGISYVGGLDENMRPKDTRTDAQKRSIQGMIISLRNKHSDAVVVGHRDLPNVKKACPCFNAKLEYGNAKPLTKAVAKAVDPILDIARKLGYL